MKDKLVKQQITILENKVKDWKTAVKNIGNQCAYTDRMVEEIIKAAKELEKAYNEQFQDN